MALYPWEYEKENVLESIQTWLRTHQMLDGFCQIKVWSGLDLIPKNRLHIIKIWKDELRVNLKNIFTMTEYDEDFRFETATLSENQNVDSQFDLASKFDLVSEASKPNIEKELQQLIKKEFQELFMKYTLENAEEYLSSGRQIDRKFAEHSARIAVNKAADFLMKKYDISMPEMIKIIEQTGRI